MLYVSQRFHPHIKEYSKYKLCHLLSKCSCFNMSFLKWNITSVWLPVLKKQYLLFEISLLRSSQPWYFWGFTTMLLLGVCRHICQRNKVGSLAVAHRYVCVMKSDRYPSRHTKNNSVFFASEGFYFFYLRQLRPLYVLSTLFFVPKSWVFKMSQVHQLACLFFVISMI